MNDDWRQKRQTHLLNLIEAEMKLPVEERGMDYIADLQLSIKQLETAKEPSAFEMLPT